MSSYREGQVHQLVDKLEEEGFTADDITKLGQYKDLFGLRGVLRGTHEIKKLDEPPRKWREEDGVIYFSVTSNRTTREEWIKNSCETSAEKILRSPNFKPTNGVTTEVAVLKGELFADNDRTTENIRAEAKKRKFLDPNAELACLIREKFTDEDIEGMGLRRIVAMHEPIDNPDGKPHLLGVARLNAGRWLDSYCVRPDSRWSCESGCAFAVSNSPAG